MKLFENRPVVAVRDHPTEAAALRGLKRRGKVHSPLPGLYAVPEFLDTWPNRLQCAHLWAPDLVVVGAAAARITWWPDLPEDGIELWGARRTSPAPWLRVSRAKVPAEHIRWLGDVPVADGPLSAVQLARSVGGKAIDEALRRGVANLPQLEAALEAIPNQEGNAKVRRLLQQSRNTPWSPLEREAHRLLDQARVRGWRGNHVVHVFGYRFPVDVCFTGPKLVVELDGHQFHSDREAFRWDRIRQNLLVLAGWTVLRYTWETLDQMVAQVRAALRAHGFVPG
ncbi:endonuclease domain-containing protein [uncultured Tessaracoccus sp.]|uniref:endonuclease domain-containing protein n=1 Tax=uncultured Tessaracoccus sp. TaxID=905023 RepID=UPI0025F6B136|nr:DUF559 domain-containing protein [uncultured Tessaracoccus sp.]